MRSYRGARGLETDLQTLGKKIESKQRALEAVEATESQLASHGRGQQASEGGGPDGSTQVRGSAQKFL
jgi:hypothetical protein